MEMVKEIVPESQWLLQPHLMTLIDTTHADYLKPCRQP